MRISQRSRRVLHTFVLAAALGLAPVAAAPATASGTACDIEWGSLVKKRPGYTGKQVVDVRSGQHACFDRLVIDVNDDGKGKPGFNVRYVKKVTKDGSGATVPLRGGAKLRVIVKAPAYDDEGEPTYEAEDWAELVDVTGYRTFRQVAWAGSFEGQTTIGLGVRARLPMRAFVLKGADGTGHRVVVDVAHRW